MLLLYAETRGYKADAVIKNKAVLYSRNGHATRIGADRWLRAVVSVVATVLAAYAVVYFAHLN